ncbi:hypothetical protein ACFSQ7_22685 [Paenibacillus rhizoplanae]
MGGRAVLTEISMTVLPGTGTALIGRNRVWQEYAAVHTRGTAEAVLRCSNL